MELEYRLATQSKISDTNNNGGGGGGGASGGGDGVSLGGGKLFAGEGGGGKQEGSASSETFTFPSSASSTPPPSVAGEGEVECGGWKLAARAFGNRLGVVFSTPSLCFFFPTVGPLLDKISEGSKMKKKKKVVEQQ